MLGIIQYSTYMYAERHNSTMTDFPQGKQPKFFPGEILNEPMNCKTKP